MTRTLFSLAVALMLVAASAQAQTVGTAPTISDAAKEAQTFRALLGNYEGLATNFGKLLRVTDTFLIFEQEGVESAVVIDAVASFQFIREVDEEEGTTKEFVEIQLFSRE